MDSEDRRIAIIAACICAVFIVFFLMAGNNDTQVQKTKQACYNATNNPKECE